MKLIYLMSAFALTLSFASCNEQPKEKTTIIEVQAPRVEVKEDKKSTSIKLNSNGGSVETEKVEIEVNK